MIYANMSEEEINKLAIVSVQAEISRNVMCDHSNFIVLFEKAKTEILKRKLLEQQNTNQNYQEFGNENAAKFR